MVLNIALCDDDEADIETEEKLISDILTKKSVKYNLKSYQSPTELLNDDIIYDIAFLDIEMTEMSGIELAKKINERKQNCLILFLTNHSVYLDKAFDVNAMRYLIKPVDSNRLSAGIDSALDRISSRVQMLSTLTYKNKLSIKIPISSIIYIENTGRHTHIVSTKHDFVSSDVFSRLKNQIESKAHYFAPPHQSFFVNLRYVTHYGREGVTLTFGNKEYHVSMSRRQFNEFDKRMFKEVEDL